MQILRGAAVPSGRLPITLNAGNNQVLPYWHRISDYDAIPASTAENLKCARLLLWVPVAIRSNVSCAFLSRIVRTCNRLFASVILAAYLSLWYMSYLSGRRGCSARHVLVHSNNGQRMQAVLHTNEETCRRTTDPPLYAFGHGISYTTFEYTALGVSVDEDSFPPRANDSAPLPFGPQDTVYVRVTIQNTGERAAKWPVVMFVGDDVAIMPPSPPTVKGFTTVELEAGAEATLNFRVRCSRQ